MKIGTTAIKNAVCREFGLTPETLMMQSKLRLYSRPRQIAMYLSREIDARSFGEIGRSFGNRDHTTAVHAHQTIAALIEADPDWRERVEGLRMRLTPAFDNAREAT